MLFLGHSKLFIWYFFEFDQTNLSAKNHVSYLHIRASIKHIDKLCMYHGISGFDYFKFNDKICCNFA